MPSDKTGDGDNVVPIKPRSEAQKRGAKIGNAAAVKAQKARGAKRQAARDSGEDGPTRWQMYLAGDLPVGDWDDQELARMQTRNFHGQFAGRPPSLKPQQIREIKGELLRRGERDFSKYGLMAIKCVARIMVDETEKAADRLRAANIFLERCYGKVPETVKMAVVEAWQEDVEAVMTIMGDSEEEAG